MSEAAGDSVPRSIQAACVVLALQALALVVTAVVLLVKTVTGDPHSVAGAVLGAALAALTAVVMVACARGLLRLQPSARTPVVVIELLALPVSYTLSFDAGRVGYGAPILLSALATLYLLFTPAARGALDRDPF